MRRSGPQSVGRVMQIFEHLAVAPSGASLAELSAVTGSPKTSLAGLLQGLMDERCLDRDAGGRFRLGERFTALATRVVFGGELSALLHPVLADLASETGETVILAAVSADGHSVVYLDCAESDNPIRYAVEVGERREMYCTAGGKLLLAYMTDVERERCLEAAPIQRFTPATVADRASLDTELAAIRREGIARSRDERIVGATACAAPIFAPDGSAAAALIVAGPSERMAATSANTEGLLRRAAERCNQLSSPGSGKEKS